jgi:hypothetical protein
MASFTVDLASGGDESPPQWVVEYKDGSRERMSWREIKELYQSEKVSVPDHVKDVVHEHESKVYDWWKENVWDKTEEEVEE